MQPGVMSDGTFKKIFSSCKSSIKDGEIIGKMGAFEPY